jgi:hypothetical protein
MPGALSGAADLPRFKPWRQPGDVVATNPPTTRSDREGTQGLFCVNRPENSASPQRVVLCHEHGLEH